MTKAVELHYNVVNDNGNSEQAMRINGELFTQPNIYSIDKPDVKENKDPHDFIPTLMDELYVTITSTAIASNGDYYIGKRAYNSDTRHPMRIHIPKFEQDLPIINTIGALAGKAVISAFGKGKSTKAPKTINLTVDMVTALPIDQYRKAANVEKFAKKFMDNTHQVQVHLGNTFVTVNIEFDYVYVLQESSSAMYNLILDTENGWRNDDLFAEIIEDYELDSFTGEDVYNMPMVCCGDIGEGTFDVAMMEQYKQNPDLSKGAKMGVGYSINKALPDFIDTYGFSDIPKHQYMEYVKDAKSDWHDEAVSILKNNTKDQSEQMINLLEEIIWHKAMRKPKLLVMFGGGSIISKDEMYEPLRNLMDGCKGKLLWIPEKYATTMNVDGMQVFMNTLFPQLKAKYKPSKEKETAK